MGDHFVLFVDRLITESTLEAAIESRKELQKAQGSASVVESTAEISFLKANMGDGPPSSSRKTVECRICQDEDEDSSMEAPCSCCGSLKYAHRKCIQRWCDEKGDTTCEICHQQFKPGYTAPPQLFHYGGIPMNFRGNWEISRRDLRNPRIIAMVATDRSLIDTADYDDYPVPSTRSIVCCRSVAAIFTVLLVVRHTLPMMITGPEQDLTLLIPLLLRTVGFLLPIYVMARAAIAFHRRWQRQQGRTEHLQLRPQHLRPQAHLARVQ